eukprot:TRINITY_DN16909_c0_g1_i1.p3 TRINITY_DN16909_c0_g1~~TRINITY_DN16909_c0_g1_i1.p3  ORF type:complete len:120 (+),score=46.57 TRINITY_DN16909_c0_g1_i1:326-685(+)
MSDQKRRHFEEAQAMIDSKKDMDETVGPEPTEEQSLAAELEGIENYYKMWRAKDEEEFQKKKEKKEQGAPKKGTGGGKKEKKDKKKTEEKFESEDSEGELEMNIKSLHVPDIQSDTFED